MSIAALYDSFNNAPHRFAAVLADIKNPAELNYRVNGGETMLYLICQRGNFEQLEAVLLRGADPNVRTSKGYPPLAQVWGRDLDMLCIMLEYGADINATTTPGAALNSIAMNDIHPRAIEMVRLAMAYGAKNWHIYNHWNLGPMSTADVLAMTISQAGPPNGYRVSTNPTVTATIISLLRGYVAQPISPAAIRAAKLQSNATAQIAADAAAAAAAEAKRAEEAAIAVAKQMADAAERTRAAAAAESKRKHDTDAQSVAAAAEAKRAADAAAETKRIADIAATAEAKRVAVAAATAEGMAILTYAASLLKTIHSGTALPPALLESIRAQAAHLLIKAGQIMPPETLATIAIPAEYEHLIHYKGAFRAYWEI